MTGKIHPDGMVGYLFAGIGTMSPGTVQSSLGSNSLRKRVPKLPCNSRRNLVRVMPPFESPAPGSRVFRGERPFNLRIHLHNCFLNYVGMYGTKKTTKIRELDIQRQIEIIRFVCAHAQGKR